ncbi:MAG TPA: hypothetical protein VMZ91_10365 [Candidatus Paceibacterota bacterium]|nr:hypothetical protein [Candidatus Paceibacterota bacterium]
MKANFDKLTKGVLIFSLLLVAFSVFYYCVIFLPQKEEARLEQERQEYVAKRKGECYDIYLQEKKNWSNVEGFDYDEGRDVCIVKYKSSEPAKSKEECKKIIENLSEIKSKSLRDMILRNYFNCWNNTFIKEF